MNTEQVTLTKARRAISRTVSDAVADSLRFIEAERIPHLRASMITAVLDVYRYPLRDITIRVPESWWQHAKDAAKRRWPRMFKWLSVRYVMHRMSADDEYPCLPPIPWLGEPMRVLRYSKTPWVDDEADA